MSEPQVEQDSPHRLEVNLTADELDSIERLMSLCGFRTKKDLILNAVTLFRWAAKETLFGRLVGSIDEASGAMRYLEMPALAAIADSRPDMTPLSPEEIKRRLAGPAVPLSEFWDKEKGGPLHAANAGKVERPVGA